MKLEHRAAVELRVAGRRLEGYAAVFNSPAQIGSVRETILPGAFRASLTANHDILALVDHNPGQLLGRTASGTLRLSEDARGLAFTIDVPDTQLGRDVLLMAERHDIRGASFGFVPTDVAWPSRAQCELRAVDLHEISIIHSHAAYKATTVTARSTWRLETPADVRRRRSWLETL